MSEFNIHAESVDVEQIMTQIRARIQEKRGIDYTEEQIREMAGVKLERFLDPKNVRSDLIEHYRRQRSDDTSGVTRPIRREPPPPLPSFEFDPDIIYRSSRGAVGRILHLIRRLLNPVLKLFFNPVPIIHALHVQREINEHYSDQINYMVETHIELMDRFEQIAAKLAARAELDALTYELVNNLVVEMTRLSIDMKNHKMRVESIAGRLDFDERRARALETVVQYRQDRPAGLDRSSPPPATDGDRGADEDSAGGPERKRRRRRRGRRRGAGESSDARVDAGGGAGGETGDPAGSPPVEPAPVTTETEPASEPAAPPPTPAVSTQNAPVQADPDPGHDTGTEAAAADRPLPGDSGTSEP